MPDELPKTNTGVRLGRRPEDYVAGTAVSLPYKVVVPSGDWRPFVVIGEKQDSPPTDSMACVSFSATNSFEVQNKQQTGIELNFSDRALAKLSGTTHDGNWLYKVADEARHNGLLLESEWPTPDTFNWDEFYKDIPQDVLNQRRQYNIGYEWIQVTKENLIKHLKHAPLQIVIPKIHPIHCVLLIALEGDTAFFFDSYPPYIKTINIANIDDLALKMAFEANMNKARIVKSKNSPTVYICYPVPSQKHLEERTSLEGIAFDPANIPNSDTL